MHRKVQTRREGRRHRRKSTPTCVLHVTLGHNTRTLAPNSELAFALQDPVARDLRLRLAPPPAPRTRHGRTRCDSRSVRYRLARRETLHVLAALGLPQLHSPSPPSAVGTFLLVRAYLAMHRGAEGGQYSAESSERQLQEEALCPLNPLHQDRLRPVNAGASSFWLHTWCMEKGVVIKSID